MEETSGNRSEPQRPSCPDSKQSKGTLYQMSPKHQHIEPFIVQEPERVKSATLARNRDLEAAKISLSPKSNNV